MREEVSRGEAQKRIESLNEPYKLEILEAIKEEPITIYHIGKDLIFEMPYYYTKMSK